MDAHAPMANLALALMAAWNARDAQAFADLFTDDAEYVGGDGVLYRGRAAIRALLLRPEPLPRVALDGAPSTRIYGEVGRLVFRWAAQAEEGGRHGIVSCVLVNASGAWKIDALQNTDTP